MSEPKKGMSNRQIGMLHYARAETRRVSLASSAESLICKPLDVVDRGVLNALTASRNDLSSLTVPESSQNVSRTPNLQLGAPMQGGRNDRSQAVYE